MTVMLLEMNPQLLDQLGISITSIYDDIKRMEKIKELKVSHPLDASDHMLSVMVSSASHFCHSIYVG